MPAAVFFWEGLKRYFAQQLCDLIEFDESGYVLSLGRRGLIWCRGIFRDVRRLAWIGIERSFVNLDRGIGSRFPTRHVAAKGSFYKAKFAVIFWTSITCAWMDTIWIENKANKRKSIINVMRMCYIVWCCWKALGRILLTALWVWNSWILKFYGWHSYYHLHKGI